MLLKSKKNRLQNLYIIAPVDNFSSFIEHTSYIGFYTDCLIELLSIAASFVIFNTSASIYIGLSLYINGMKMDIQRRVMSIDHVHNSPNGPNGPQTTKYWSIYMREIEFHLNIIRYPPQEAFERVLC